MPGSTLPARDSDTGSACQDDDSTEAEGAAEAAVRAECAPLQEAPPAAQPPPLQTGHNLHHQQQQRHKGDGSAWSCDGDLPEGLVKGLHDRLLARAVERVTQGKDVNLVDPMKPSGVCSADLQHTSTLLKVIEPDAAAGHGRAIHSSEVGLSPRKRGSQHAVRSTDEHAEAARGLYAKASKIVVDTASILQNARPHIAPRKPPGMLVVQCLNSNAGLSQSNLSQIEQAISGGEDARKGSITPPFPEGAMDVLRAAQHRPEGNPSGDNASAGGDGASVVSPDSPRVAESGRGGPPRRGTIEVLSENSAIRERLERADEVEQELHRLRIEHDLLEVAAAGQREELERSEERCRQLAGELAEKLEEAAALESDLGDLRRENDALLRGSQGKSRKIHAAANRAAMGEAELSQIRAAFFDVDFDLRREKQTTFYLQSMVADMRSQEEDDSRVISSLRETILAEQRERDAERESHRIELASAKVEITTLTERCKAIATIADERDALLCRIDITEKNVEGQQQVAAQQAEALRELTRSLGVSEGRLHDAEEKGRALEAEVAESAEEGRRLGSELEKCRGEMAEAGARHRQELAVAAAKSLHLSAELDQSNARAAARESHGKRMRRFATRVMVECIQLRVTLARRNASIESLYSDVSRTSAIHRENKWLVHKFSHTLDDINEIKSAMRYQAQLHRQLCRSNPAIEAQCMGLHDHSLPLGGAAPPPPPPPPPASTATVSPDLGEGAKGCRSDSSSPPGSPAKLFRRHSGGKVAGAAEVAAGGESRFVPPRGCPAVAGVMPPAAGFGHLHPHQHREESQAPQEWMCGPSGGGGDDAAALSPATIPLSELQAHLQAVAGGGGETPPTGEAAAQHGGGDGLREGGVEGEEDEDDDEEEEEEESCDDETSSESESTAATEVRPVGAAVGSPRGGGVRRQRQAGGREAAPAGSPPRTQEHHSSVRSHVLRRRVREAKLADGAAAAEERQRQRPTSATSGGRPPTHHALPHQRGGGAGNADAGADIYALSTPPSSPGGGGEPRGAATTTTTTASGAPRSRSRRQRRHPRGGAPLLRGCGFLSHGGSASAGGAGRVARQPLRGLRGGKAPQGGAHRNRSSGAGGAAAADAPPPPPRPSSAVAALLKQSHAGEEGGRGSPLAPSPSPSPLPEGGRLSFVTNPSADAVARAAGGGGGGGGGSGATLTLDPTPYSFFLKRLVVSAPPADTAAVFPPPAGGGWGSCGATGSGGGGGGGGAVPSPCSAPGGTAVMFGGFPGSDLEPSVFLRDRHLYEASRLNPVLKKRTQQAGVGGGGGGGGGGVRGGRPRSAPPPPPPPPPPPARSDEVPGDPLPRQEEADGGIGGDGGVAALAAAEARFRFQPPELPASHNPLVSPAYRIWGVSRWGDRASGGRLGDDEGGGGGAMDSGCPTPGAKSRWGGGAGGFQLSGGLEWGGEGGLDAVYGPGGLCPVEIEAAMRPSGVLEARVTGSRSAAISVPSALPESVRV